MLRELGVIVGIRAILAIGSTVLAADDRVNVSWRLQIHVLKVLQTIISSFNFVTTLNFEVGSLLELPIATHAPKGRLLPHILSRIFKRRITFIINLTFLLLPFNVLLSKETHSRLSTFSIVKVRYTISSLFLWWSYNRFILTVIRFVMQWLLVNFIELLVYVLYINLLLFITSCIFLRQLRKVHL